MLTDWYDNKFFTSLILFKKVRVIQILFYCNQARLESSNLFHSLRPHIQERSCKYRKQFHHYKYHHFDTDLDGIHQYLKKDIGITCLRFQKGMHCFRALSFVILDLVIPVSQFSPSYPGRQLHTYEYTSSIHVPSFLQGFVSHALSSWKIKIFNDLWYKEYLYMRNRLCIRNDPTRYLDNDQHKAQLLLAAQSNDHHIFRLSFYIWLG